MKFEEDYVMRMIKDMVKALACVVFGKRFTEYEAENILLTDMDRTDKRYMEMAMSFYLHINKYTDEFLSANGYSRQEILDGVEALAEANGIKGLDGLSDGL